MKGWHQDLGLKTVSLILAVFLWAAVRLVGGPASEIPSQRVFTVPIRVTPPERSELVPELGLKEVTLTLRGSRGVIDRVRPEMIQADVDLGRRGAGDWVERIVAMAPGGTEVISIEPPYVGVRISARRSAQVPVRVLIKGAPAAGYQAGEPVLEPRHVKVTGPEVQIDQVVAVEGTLSLSGSARGESALVRSLVPVSSQGLPVDLVRVEPEQVLVTVPVTFAQRLSGVAVDLRNLGAGVSKGWRVTYEVEPQVVTLQGPPDREAPPAILTRSATFQPGPEAAVCEVELVVPEGFTLIGSSKVRVTARFTRPKR